MNIPMHAKSASAPPNSAVGAARNRSTIQESAPAKGATKKPAEAKAPMGRSGSAGWSDLPSSRLKSVKCADPFATKANQFKTKFGSVYNGGGIPCRLNHGAVNIKLQWSTDPMELDYDPLLVTCAEGLCETEHPYAFASRACFGELLAADSGPDKAVPLVPRIVPSIRAALVSPNKKVFEGGVEAAQQLSQAVGEALNPHINVLVVQMNKRSSDKQLAGKILSAIQSFEEYGGADAFKVIKSKVPTYCSIYI